MKRLRPETNFGGRDRHGMLLLMYAELHHNEFLLLSLKDAPSEPAGDRYFFELPSRYVDQFQGPLGAAIA